MVQVRLLTGEIRQFDSFADAWRFANDVGLRNVAKISIGLKRWVIKCDIWNPWQEQKIWNIGGQEYQSRNEGDIFLVNEDLGVLCDFITDHKNEPKTYEYYQAMDCAMILEVLSTEKFANRYRNYVE